MKINKIDIGHILMSLGVLLVIILTIVKVNYDDQAQFLCDRFHDSNLDINECPAHNSNTSWFITSAFAIAILISVIGIYFTFFDREKEAYTEKNKDFKKIDINKLDEEEKLLYNKILEKDGSIYQSDLVRDLGYTKVKVTRLLDRLETKNVIERKRRGMTNIIVLK